MKKSELLKIQADEEENDFRFWNIHHKAIREERIETFDEFFLPKIKDSHLVSVVESRPDQSLYLIKFSDGVEVAYYPKKDRLCIKKGNQWKCNGRTWIMNKIQKN